jgi:hypothetical protein
MFNARMTHEGLLDLANRVAVDGPRCCLVMDELSLRVSGAGQRLASVITLDELIGFVDDNGEVTKGAASKIRRLRGAKISCLAGVQLDCLPDVFGGSVGRNIISRFTVIATVYQLHVRLCLAFVEVFFSGHLGILWPLRFGCFCCRQSLRWEPARPHGFFVFFFFHVFL